MLERFQNAYSILQAWMRRVKMHTHFRNKSVTSCMSVQNILGLLLAIFWIIQGFLNHRYKSYCP